MFEYAAALRRVIDGDTLELSVDLGFSISSTHSLRLAGVSAAELHTPDGKAAKAWVEQWAKDNPGPYVITTTKGRETEKYGRYLARLIDTISRHCLNDDLLAAGQATPYAP